MAPGARSADQGAAITAVSASNGCHYCIASHSAAARAKGMSEAQYSELLAIVGFCERDHRLVTALGVPVDERFQ